MVRSLSHPDESIILSFTTLNIGLLWIFPISSIILRKLRNAAHLIQDYVDLKKE